MSKANYIIFHPDSQRQKMEVSATVLENGVQKENWHRFVWADRLGGDDDPFIFSDPWLYSYCHATQLHRQPRKDGIIRAPKEFNGGLSREAPIRISPFDFIAALTRFWVKGVMIIADFSWREPSFSGG